jgi:hypothetical protein
MGDVTAHPSTRDTIITLNDKAVNWRGFGLLLLFILTANGFSPGGLKGFYDLIEALCRHFPGGTEEIHEGNIAGVSVEIRTEHLPNTSVDSYRCASLYRSLWRNHVKICYLQDWGCISG